MKYLIIGSGGVGGSTAAYMFKGNLDVSLLLRSKRYEEVTKNGFAFKETECEILPIKTVNAENMGADYDVVIIAVKDYDLQEVCRQYKDKLGSALIVPMMNGLSGGRVCSEIMTGNKVMDACVYLTAGKTAGGEISKTAGGFKIVLEATDDPRGNALAQDLASCGINVKVTEKIAVDKFLKFFFISPLSMCQAFYATDCGSILSDPEKLSSFTKLSNELYACGVAKGLELPENCVERNIERLKKMPANYYSSMAKDYLSGHRYERTIMLDDVVDMADSLGIEVPGYKNVQQALKKY